MKMTRFGEPQILAIRRPAEGGVPVADLCRENGMSTASFYKWRAKRAWDATGPSDNGECGMDASMISQMKSLEDENRGLKRYCGPKHAGGFARGSPWKKVTGPSTARQ